ncbi:MAG: low temperature requirement protein A [Streptosporangiaceae bacterium]
MTRDRPPRNLRRSPGGAARVTNVELFFDLVYVFAVTQLSDYLIAHRSAGGALQALLLLTMVWLAWAYTTWVTNWLDPGRIPVRVMLLALALVSLVFSAALPDAFGSRGLAVGLAYAVMQIGRSLFAVWALRGDRLRRNFQRILAWCVASGALAVAGGVAAGQARELLWLAAVAVDIVGGLAGFWTPGLGRSTTRDWTIEGGHFAERCQAFILIALGESIVVTGATLSRLHSVTGQEAAAFLAAFVGSVGLWWLYFHRSADAGAEAIARSADPGRLGRSAYHLIHPVMVAGIIVIAAGDQIVLDRPGVVGSTAVSVMLLGGTALFLIGHTLFKAVVWRRVSAARLAGVAALALLGVVAPHIPAVALSGCVAVVVLAVAAADYLTERSTAPDGADDAAGAVSAPSGAGPAG